MLSFTQFEMVLSFRCHYFGSEYTVAGDLWGGESKGAIQRNDSV